MPGNWKDKSILLHFGAVDWKTEVFLNGVMIGSHLGGYTPFSFDISPYLTSGEQTLIVKVWDPTDDGYQAIGKQKNAPEGIWYTPVSGIWQTVWIEPVAAKSISSVTTIPNIDAGSLAVAVDTRGTEAGDIVEVIVKDGATVVSTAKFAADQSATVAILDAKLWSPDSPFLYDLELNLYSKGKLQDM